MEINYTTYFLLNLFHGPKIFLLLWTSYSLFSASSHKSAKETTRFILKQLTFPLHTAPHHAACPDEFPMCLQRDATHRTA